MDELSWQRLRHRLVSEFRLGPYSAHDDDHWRRVEAYGLYLARQNGADLEVVRLFAWLHDSQRHSEGYDPEHGPRAAAWAQQWCGKAFTLSPQPLGVLMEACRDHERGLTSQEPTVGACWDADRLDLDRVGKAVDPDFLSTVLGRKLARLRPMDRRKRVGL